jgi:hypothetical protein
VVKTLLAIALIVGQVVQTPVVAAKYALSVVRNGVTETVYEPQPHQRLFHEATEPNVIMEGGAGSGKSICMRFDAYMRAMSTPGFKALILRRSFPELELSHLQHVDFERERLGLAKDAWHSTKFTLRFKHGVDERGRPRPDSIVVFGHAENDDTIAKYLSSEWEAIYFDELCTFTLKQFTFISSRARTTIPGLRPIIRGGTNPVGPGASWVRRFFITKKPKLDESPDYDPTEWRALHSTVRDNKHVDQKEYIKRLRNIPSEALRKAFDTGEWTIEGQFFSEFMEQRSLDDGTAQAWHTIKTLPQYKGEPLYKAKWMQIIRVVDWGYSADGNPGVCLWFAVLPDWSAICFKQYYFKQTLPKDVALQIRKRSEGMKIAYTVGDPAMWREHVGESIAQTFAANKVGMIEADNERKAGWVNVHTWLRTIMTDVAGDRVIERPKMQFYVPEDGTDLDGNGVPDVVRSMPEMVIDPKDPEDIQTRNVEDDGPDCVRYFCMSRPSPSKEPKAQTPPHLREVMAFIKKKQGAHGRLRLHNGRRR